MIICVIGTRAQLIKMAPVLLELEQRDTAYRLVFTGQHQVTMPELLAEFGVVTTVSTLYEGPEIKGIGRMAWWLPRVLVRGLSSRRAVFRKDDAPRHCVVVHGDTFSTLLGALLARLHGYDVVHVEAGLTSGRWREPFPEELTRRLVFRLATLAYCPGDWAWTNMGRYAAERVDTGANTIIDAVRRAVAQPVSDEALPAGDYAVVSLHRFENIFRRERYEFIIDQLEQMARRIPLAFVLHPATRAQGEKFGLLSRLERHAEITLYPRMTYLPFMRLISGARFVVTDGGSNQEELAALGKPTLLMRDATERLEGLGEEAVLAHYDEALISNFLDAVLERPPTPAKRLAEIHPAALIAADLQARYGNVD